MGYYRIGTHLRLKPSSRPSPALHVDAANSSLRVDLKHAGGGPPRNHGDQIVFHFDSIIQSTSQEATFNDCGLKIVEDFLCGYNGTVLAYGQSGSGKTFTMSGDPKSALHKGIIPRAIHRIFIEKSARPESETSIYVSYLEVYNEVIYDLLTERKESSRIVTIMEENCLMEMKGLSQFHCDTEEDALRYFLRGERRRSVSANAVHKMANRSHCMFTIYVERHTKMRGHPDRTAARLNLVDLAGCERFKCADAARQSEKEILSINKSLTFLEQAVLELRKGQGHVSFRQSRLTMLLKDALGGNSRTVLIVCAVQEHDFLDEMIKETFYIFKEAQLALHAKMEKSSKDDGILKIEENQTTNVIDDKDGVGELEAQGFHVGVAPLDSRPAKMDTGNTDATKVVSGTPSSTVLQQSSEDKNLYGGDHKTKNLAFLEFKHTTSEGLQHCYFLKGRKSELKEKKHSVQKLYEKMKDCKREIHEINCLLVMDHANGMASCEQTEEHQMKAIEQEQLRERLELAKTEYQKSFGELTLSKAQIQSIRKEILEYQESLLDSFFKWYKGDKGK